MFNKAGMLAVMSKYLVPENDRFDGAMPIRPPCTTILASW